MNKMPEAELDEPFYGFSARPAETIYDLFGRHAFRKHTPVRTHRSIVNASLWDVCRPDLSRYSKKWWSGQSC